MPGTLRPAPQRRKVAARRSASLPPVINPLIYDVHLSRGESGRVMVQNPKFPAVAGQLIRWHLDGFDRAVLGPFMDGSIHALRVEATPTAPACALAVQKTGSRGTHYRISVDAGSSPTSMLKASVLYTLIITDSFPGPVITGRVVG